MRTKWAYKIERIKLPVFSGTETKNRIVEETLNRRGLEGWELVHGLPSLEEIGGTCFYLKRPI